MRMAVSDFELEIIPGKIEDIPLILSLIHKMAEFEKLKVEATKEILEESLFGDLRAAQTLLAYIDKVPVAYGTYFYTFSSMLGKRGLWLDDLFVVPEARGKGIGKAVIAYLTDIAIKNNCGRFEWIVLDWNKPAIDFYKNLGANILNEWQLCRLDEDKFLDVTKGLIEIEK